MNLSNLNPFREKQKVLNLDEVLAHPDFGWSPIATNGTYSHYKRNDYENAYPSISRIANGFMAVEPFAIDDEGNKVQSNAIDRLYYPSKEMSAVDFREALGVMSLVHDKVHIRVHGRKNQRGIIPDSITGYTFLETRATVDQYGKQTFFLPGGTVLDDSDIITLRDVNPYHVLDGFSPTRSARRWLKLDDYIADYQQGFFENGAVPSGMFIITARNEQDYLDIKQAMQAKHRGAGKNNNVMYNYRPAASQGGQKMDAQIEWVPFNTPNKDMALDEIFSQANKKVDSAYGVPASLRAVNDNNTYASVRVDEQIFVNYTLRPRTLKIWNKFSHELARVTGGYGASIGFYLPTPVIADEEKVKAEARSIESATYTRLVAEGYEPKSVIAYIKSDDLSKLTMKVVEEVDDVVDNDDTEEAPSQGESVVKSVKKKVLTETDRVRYERQLEDVVRGRMEAQITAVRQSLDTILSKQVTEDNPVDEVEDARLSAEMQAVLLTVILSQGRIEQNDNINLILTSGIQIDDILPFEMNVAQRRRYGNYINKLAESYNDQTRDRIRGIIANGRTNNLTVQQISDNLSEVLAEEWRIRRIAVSEINRAGNEASLMSMQQIADQTGASVDKEWVHVGSDTPCEYCQALIGTTVELNEPFIPLGGEVSGVAGGVYVNNFIEEQTASLHPNDHCRQVYRIRR